MRVAVERDGRVESEHRVLAVTVDADANLRWSSGPEAGAHPTFLRSAAKPFQAAAAVVAGVADRFGLDDRHLAVASGSHNASARHLAVVDEILAGAGLDRSALRCGDDGQGGSFHHQCSGNHALGLAWCVAEGWPTDSYLERDHPLQRAYFEAVASASGEEPACAPDGCGMTAFQVTLAGYAVAYARLGTTGSSVPGGSRVAAAMRSHPELVGWSGKPDTEVMRGSAAFIAKTGAEGTIGAGHAAGVGAAVKVLDGSARAFGPAIIETLSRDALTSSDAGLVDPAVGEVPVRDGQGRQVGVIAVR